MPKGFFGGLELLRPEVIEPTKMPRTAATVVVRDMRTGYLNAGTYSCGVFSLKPLCILFGPKGADIIDTFCHADEFCAAVPRREQIDHMWVTALEIPHGISEIDVAGWHELPSHTIATPGIAECPLNLECRIIFRRPLPHPWRTIVIGEVVGVSIDTSILSLPRSEAVRLFPMHEAGSHPQTGLYAPTVLSGELISSAFDNGDRKDDENHNPSMASLPADAASHKKFVSGSALFSPENEDVLVHAIWPMPAYVVLSGSGKDVHVLPVCGGSLQSTEPAVQIPLPKNSPTYHDIRSSGDFVVAVPDRSLVAQFEHLEHGSLQQAGFTLLRPNMVKTPGLAECRVNMDCKVVMLEDVPGTDLAILVGRRVGVALDEEIWTRLDPMRYSLSDRLTYINELYASYMYAVIDRGGVRRWGFHDKNGLSVRPLPSWGSRYAGGWWGPGPALNYWLIELCQSGLLTKPDYYKIMFWLRLWNNGRLIPHLAEYIDPAMKDDLRQRLTRLFHMMAWAHRDLSAWQAVREFLAQFPDAPRDHHSGPLYHEKWYDAVV